MFRELVVLVIYVLGVVISFILFLRITAREYGEMTLTDLLVCLAFGMLSWLSIVAVLMGRLDEKVIWRRKGGGRND